MAASKKITAPETEVEEVPWPEEKEVQVETAPTEPEPANPDPIEENIEMPETSMEPQEPQQTTSPGSFGLEMKEKPQGGRNWLLIAGLALLVLALLGGGYYYYKNNMSGEEMGATPTESAYVAPIVSPTPAETPAPEIDRAAWSLEVLNGTGKSGLAAEVKTKLEDMGYTVSKIGNATETDTTKIYVAKKMSDKQDELLKDLKDEFGVEEVTGVLSDSSASARIVIGTDYLK